MAEVAAYEVSLIDERLTVDGDGGVPASDGAGPGDGPEAACPRRVARQAAGSPDPADPADAADASNTANAARSSRSANAADAADAAGSPDPANAADAANASGKAW